MVFASHILLASDSLLRDEDITQWAVEKLMYGKIIWQPFNMQLSYTVYSGGGAISIWYYGKLILWQVDFLRIDLGLCGRWSCWSTPPATSRVADQTHAHKRFEASLMPSPSYAKRKKESGQKGRTNASGWNAIIDNSGVRKIKTNRHFHTVCKGQARA